MSAINLQKYLDNTVITSEYSGFTGRCRHLYPSYKYYTL